MTEAVCTTDLLYVLFSDNTSQDIFPVQVVVRSPKAGFFDDLANGQSQADWLDVVAWDRTAEFVCKYFQKGSLIAIDGRLQSRSYQDKNGNNRTAIEIVANNVNFAAPKSANAAPMGDAGYGAPTAAPAPRPAAQAAPAPSYSAGSNDDFALIEDEGDLPF